MIIWIFISSFLLSFVWFKSGHLLGAGESGIPFFNSGWHFLATKFAWKVSTLGNLTGITTASAPTYWFLEKLEALGIPSFLIQAFVFWLLFFVSGLAIYFFTKQLFPKLSEKAALIAVLFYWFNPSSLVNVWNRFVNNGMVFFALLPLASFFYIKGMQTRNWAYAIFSVLSTFIFSYALTSTPFNILLGFVFFYSSLYYFITERDLSNKIFYIKYFLLTIVAFVGVNFWWIGQFFSFSYSPDFLTTLSSFFSPEGNLGTLTTLSQKLGNLIDVVRLKHATFFSSEEPSWQQFFDFPLFRILEFLVPAFILATIIKGRKVREILYLGTLFIAGLFLAKGNNPPLGEVFEFPFLNIHFLQVFRNPFEKFSIIIALAASPLFALSLDKLSFPSKIKKHLIVFFLLFVGFFWGFPFWTGLVFTGKILENGQPRSYKVKIPDYYWQVNDWLKKQNGDFRFLSLPIGGEGITYNWENRYSGIELSSSIFEISNVSLNTTIPFYNRLVSKISEYQNSENLLKFLPFINARFIVLRSDIDFRDRKMADPQTIRRNLEEFVSEGSLSRKYEAGSLAVYELTPSLFWSKIFVSPRIIVSDDSNLTNSRAVVVPSLYLSKGDFLESPMLVEPEKVFSPISGSSLKNMSERDILARLFYVKHTPNVWFYPAIRLKELVETPPKRDFSGWILYKVGILGKRAVEVYRVKSDGKSENLIKKTESEYEGELKRLSYDISQAISGESPVGDVVRDSLLFQLVLLEKVHSASAKALTEYLLKAKIKPYFDLPQISSGTYLIYHFDVPIDAKFKLEGTTLGDRSKLFIDNNAVAVTETDPANVELTKGIHEIALLPEDKDIYEVVESEQDFALNENSGWRREIALSRLPEIYRIEFDYRFEEGKVFGLRFSQDIDSAENPVMSTRVSKDEFFHDWKHFEGKFTTTNGAVGGILEVYPIARTSCSRKFLVKRFCEDSLLKFNVDLRNFKVTTVKYPQIRLVRNGLESLGPETTIEWSKVNPTRYNVKINKLDAKAEMLVFSELFNSGWEASFEDGSKIPSQKHFLVNVYANGWLIDKTGNYQISLRFLPQKTLELGVRISAIFLTASLLFIGISLWKKGKDSI